MKAMDVQIDVPAGEQERRQAYVFQWNDTDLFGITLEPAGTNLPCSGEGTWHSRGEIVLGVRDPLALPIDPEPVLRGIRADGYFTWRLGQTHPFGTSQ